MAVPVIPTITPVRCADGAVVAAYTYRDGDVTASALPLFMLHGNGGSHASFWRMAQLFARERLVVAPDSRGQGISTRGERPLTYELLADDALAVLDALGLERAAVLGYSDGGIEALLLARDHPGRIAGIVTLGANLTPEGVVFGSDEPSLAAQEKLLHSVASVLPAASAQAELLRLMEDEPHIDAASLSDIRCPATIMAGDGDVIVPEETDAIAAAIPDARKIIVPDAGHSLMKDAFDTVVAEVRSLLERAESCPRSGQVAQETPR